MVTLTCSIAMMATTTGKIFGLNGTRKNAVRLRAEAALKKSRSSTRWFMCQCSTVLTITMCLCRCLPHPTSSTRTVMSICLRKSSMSTRIMNSTMTAMKATPIGSSDGLHTRSPGAVTTWPWDALALGMAATTSTLMSLPKEWDTHMGEFMIAMLASPIGCRAGRVPRRTGAARNTTRAAWNSIAALVLSLDCSGFLRFTKAYYHESWHIMTIMSPSVSKWPLSFFGICWWWPLIVQWCSMILIHFGRYSLGQAHMWAAEKRSWCPGSESKL